MKLKNVLKALPLASMIFAGFSQAVAKKLY